MPIYVEKNMWYAHIAKNAAIYIHVKLTSLINGLLRM